MGKSETRLDASESVFFDRELESIDATVYDIKFPLLKGRQLVPKINGVSENDREYTYRQYETFGEAKVIANAADDLPTVDTTGREFTARIKPVGDKYTYDLFEIRAAAEKGRPLDDLKARSARRAIEEKIDMLIAFGSTIHDMKGFANHASVDDSFTPSTKNAGGTTWLLAGQPNATAREVVDDINRFVNELWSALKEAEGIGGQIVLVLPATEYAYAASLPMGDNADKTALKYVLENNPFLEDVIPWHKLASGSGPVGDTLSSNRMIAYVRDPLVCGALIPMEFSPQPYQQKGLVFEIPCISSCGGTVIRYPVAMRYGNAI